MSAGWSVWLRPDVVFVDFDIDGVDCTRWRPSAGKLWIPGDPGYFRAHEPEQAQALLDYGFARLSWQASNGLLPHLAHCGWAELSRAHAPPWDPVHLPSTQHG